MKEKPVKKKTDKNGRTFDVISVLKQGQSLIKQRFITLSHFLDLFITIPECGTQ
jgi:hypothetical protein